MALKPPNRRVRITTYVSEEEDKQIQALVLAHPFIDNVADLVRHAVLGSLQAAPSSTPAKPQAEPEPEQVKAPSDETAYPTISELNAAAQAKRAAKAALEAKLAAEEAKLEAKELAKEAAAQAKLEAKEKAAKARVWAKLGMSVPTPEQDAAYAAMFAAQRAKDEAEQASGLVRSTPEPVWGLTPAEIEAKADREAAARKAARDAQWEDAQQHNQQTDARKVPDYD